MSVFHHVKGLASEVLDSRISINLFLLCRHNEWKTAGTVVCQKYAKDLQIKSPLLEKKRLLNNPDLCKETFLRVC